MLVMTRATWTDNSGFETAKSAPERLENHLLGSRSVFFKGKLAFDVVVEVGVCSLGEQWAIG